MNGYLQETAVAHRLRWVSDHRVAGRSSQRLLGAFNTDSSAAEAMARWTVRSSRDRLLEPSFGDGTFLRAVAKVARERGLPRVTQFGTELVREPFAAALSEGLLLRANAFLGDFLGLEPFEVDAVIGNPPYVRLRHLPPSQLHHALRAASMVLGEPMATSGSLWMAFVLHCLRFLRRGGRLALVLPHELTHVRYARPLWTKLGQSFADLRVVRVQERLFPDILQGVVLFLADGYGGTTKTVRFQAFERASDFVGSTQEEGVSLAVEDIVAGERVFLRALLPKSTQEVLAEVLSKSTIPINATCAFNIGYVAGDKDFFHPSEGTIRRYGLSTRSLRATLTSSRQLKTGGLRTSNPNCAAEKLFLPSANKAKVSDGDLRYIALGKGRGIHKRYKCRVRQPWYVVPGVRVPDILLSVFAERPVLAVNDAGLVASNSLLCGYLRNGTAEDLAAAWYSSLTLLQCELLVHSLGGGVFVLVPGEVANLRVPTCSATKTHLRSVDGCLATGNIESAYKSGDESILRKRVGLSTEQINELRGGIDVLRRWRTSSRGRPGGTETAELA